jgi:hypothetical protein
VTDLERFAAILLAEWQAETGQTDAILPLGDLLDTTFPYKKARRALSLESSEYYDLLVLRLVAEEAGLVETRPPEAGEMARATLAEKVPDLDQLHLLRSAAITFSEDAVSRLEGVRPMPQSAAARALSEEAEVPSPEPTSVPELEHEHEHESDQVIPIRPPVVAADATATSRPAIPSEPPPEFLTGVAFTPPQCSCWQCDTPLPTGRAVKFCVECGSDQRVPHCSSCDATLERAWKHCAECGAPQARS